MHSGKEALALGCLSGGPGWGEDGLTNQLAPGGKDHEHQNRHSHRHPRRSMRHCNRGDGSHRRAPTGPATRPSERACATAVGAVLLNGPLRTNTRNRRGPPTSRGLSVVPVPLPTHPSLGTGCGAPRCRTSTRESACIARSSGQAEP